MAMPSNIPTSIAELAELSDEMWYLAGDTGVDTSWYTKRATLSAVYASTGMSIPNVRDLERCVVVGLTNIKFLCYVIEMFMTQDQSPDFSSTWKFLDRRLQDVYILGKTASEVGDYLGFTAHAVMNILRSKSIIR